MKKFTFRLQKLLDIREKAEKDIKNELAALISLQNLEKAKQEELRKHIEIQKVKFRNNLLKGEYSAFEALTHERFIDVSFRAIELAEKKIQDMEPGINAVRRRLIEASREKKVVEKLKERKLDEYNYKFNWETAKENDDINQKIYVKKQIDSREEAAG